MSKKKGVLESPLLRFGMILTSCQLVLMGDNRRRVSVVFESSLQNQNQALPLLYAIWVIDVALEKDSQDPHHHLKLDQDIYHEKVAETIIKHNYPFMSMEHKGVRELHCYRNPSKRNISRNTVKADVQKIFGREHINLKPRLRSNSSRI